MTSMGSKASKDGIYITEMNDLNLSFEEKEARQEIQESINNEGVNNVVPSEDNEIKDRKEGGQS